MLLSIVVPVYNAEKYLRECIRSVLCQSYEKFELILVDDGSQDNSGELCDQYMHCDPRVRVIHKLNEGVVAARQTGAEMAKGDYLIFVDADDYIMKDSLLAISSILEKYKPDIVAYGFKAETRKGIEDKYIKNPGWYDKKQIEESIFPYLIQTDNCKYFPPSVWGKAFKSQLYKTHQCVDRNIVIGEDAASTVACLYYADSLYIINKCLYYYRLNDESVTKSNKTYDWNCAKRIADFWDNKIDLSTQDLRQQLYRYVVHMLFIIGCSQFNCAESNKVILKSIHQNLSKSYYMDAVKKARFKCLSKGWAAQFILKYRLYGIMKLWNHISSR